MGVPEEDVSELMQEVFIQVHQKFHEFEGGSGKAWLKAFCVNAVRNWRRLVRHQMETQDEASAEQVVDGQVGPEQAATRRDQWRMLQKALQTLPEAQREVFVMFELEQMTSAEIAQLLQIPLGTVQSRLRLARKAFQAHAAQLKGEYSDV
jgi:RNA polymerase sigma-70 factor (ECF subfamily)